MAGVLPDNASLVEVTYYPPPVASVAVLVSWMVIPVALGYRRYQSLDL